MSAVTVLDPGESIWIALGGAANFMSMSSTHSAIARWSPIGKPVIGMVHLLPLPGSPGYGGSLGAIREAALRDADALSVGGAHALMIENFGDVPFFPNRVPAHVIAHMTAIAHAVRERFELPIGVNVLRNDGLGALAVAHAAGADFIRVNVLCSARVADQGLLQGIAHDLLRERALLGAQGVRILADVDVKHSAAIASRPLADDIEDTLYRGLADALVVSGSGTGKATAVEKVRLAKGAAGRASVFVGSGVSADTIADYVPFADGFIVGTAFKQDGNPRNPVEAHRVRELIDALSRASM